MAITRIPTVRKAWYAGSWYAADAPTLRSTISKAVEQAQFWQKRSESESEVHCALVPHAGLAYSARGIAHLLDQRRERETRVLILGPSHNVVLPDNTLSFGLFSKYETPLGSLDSFSVGLESQGPDAIRTLQKEHSVEMVLPFLATLQERQNWPIKVAMALINRVSDASNA